MGVLEGGHQNGLRASNLGELLNSGGEFFLEEVRERAVNIAKLDVIVQGVNKRANLFRGREISTTRRSDERNRQNLPE